MQDSLYSVDEHEHNHQCHQHFRIEFTRQMKAPLYGQSELWPTLKYRTSILTTNHRDQDNEKQRSYVLISDLQH